MLFPSFLQIECISSKEASFFKIFFYFPSFERESEKERGGAREFSTGCVSPHAYTAKDALGQCQESQICVVLPHECQRRRYWHSVLLPP